MSEARWTRERWLVFGETRLKEAGPQALGLDALCIAAGRTKGSFYHHFPGTEGFVEALVARWREHTTDRIGEVALAARSPETASRTLLQLVSRIDPRLDLAMRGLAASRPEAARAIAAMDDRREQILAELMKASYGLDEDRALAAARLFHAVYLSAQMRAPDDIRAFTDPPYSLLRELLAAASGPKA